jgi:hypothetical protein
MYSWSGGSGEEISGKRERATKSGEVIIVIVNTDTRK